MLVTGAAGQVGTECVPRLRAAGFDVVAAARTDLDLTDAGKIREVVARVEPDAVVNCAAYNAVDQAEADPGTAMVVNAEGVGVLAEACAARVSHFVHLSSDYVFPGDKGSAYDETDAPDPASTYGKSKLAGEEAVRAAGGRWAIVRTAWVFGAIGRSLVETILQRGRVGEPLRMVHDQRGSPTHAGDLADALVAVVERGAQGMLHVTNEGDCSPYELADLVLATAGIDRGGLEAISLEELGRPAARPRNSALVSVRLADVGLDPLRPLEEAVAERVKELL